MTALGRQKPSIGLACAHVVAKTSQGLIHACIFIVAHPKKGTRRGGGANAGARDFYRAGGARTATTARRRAGEIRTWWMTSIWRAMRRTRRVRRARYADDDSDVELSTFARRDAARSDEPSAR